MRFCAPSVLSGKLDTTAENCSSFCVVRKGCLPILKINSLKGKEKFIGLKLKICMAKKVKDIEIKISN